MEYLNHTASFVSREECDCDYKTIILVVVIIRKGDTPMDNYELGAAQDVKGMWCEAKNRDDNTLGDVMRMRMLQCRAQYDIVA